MDYFDTTQQRQQVIERAIQEEAGHYKIDNARVYISASSVKSAIQNSDLPKFVSEIPPTTEMYTDMCGYTCEIILTADQRKERHRELVYKNDDTQQTILAEVKQQARYLRLIEEQHWREQGACKNVAYVPIGESTIAIAPVFGVFAIVAVLIVSLLVEAAYLGYFG